MLDELLNEKKVFPAVVGINREITGHFLERICVPRSRGD